MYGIYWNVVQVRNTAEKTMIPVGINAIAGMACMLLAIMVFIGVWCHVQTLCVKLHNDDPPIALYGNLIAVCMQILLIVLLVARAFGKNLLL